MPKDSDTIEQAVSRTVRDSLERLQRAADELHHAVADVISACSSRKPANVLPPMLRAQTAAAALAATLDILVRFISNALQPGPRPFKGGEAEEALRLVSIPAPEPSPAPTMPPRSLPVPMSEVPEPAATAGAEGQVAEQTVQTMDVPAAVAGAEPDAVPAAETSPPIPSAVEGTDTSLGDPTFQIADLPIEEQELHRRANRVAKVSMQDIKMLRPDQVRVGQENRDICVRLRDEIEKAHKEYDRRFRPILGHPVDYFYYWMVQILGGGDPERLGEYPYRSPVVRR